MITRRCTWRTCRAPGPWTITAGKAGSGQYAQAGACDAHVLHVERRTKRYANGEPATIERAPETDIETDTQQQVIGGVSMWQDGR